MTSREEFEAWCRSKGAKPSLVEEFAKLLMWEAWQAARATPTAEVSNAVDCGRDSVELGPYEFDVKLGEQMYIDSSMQYRNGTVNLTIKRQPRTCTAAIEAQRSGDGS